MDTDKFLPDKGRLGGVALVVIANEVKQSSETLDRHAASWLAMPILLGVLSC